MCLCLTPLSSERRELDNKAVPSKIYFKIVLCAILGACRRYGRNTLNSFLLEGKNTVEKQRMLKQKFI